MWGRSCPEGRRLLLAGAGPQGTSPSVQGPGGDGLTDALGSMEGGSLWGARRVVPVTLPVSRACGHLFSWPRGLSAPRAAALCGAPAAGGGQTGVSGGRGFIFSPTASVILSLWRYWAGAHQAPPVVPQAAGLLCGDLSGCVCVHVCARVRARQRDRDVPCGLGQGCFASLAGLHFLT